MKPIGIVTRDFKVALAPDHWAERYQSDQGEKGSKRKRLLALKKKG